MPVGLFSKNESQSAMSINCSRSNSTSVAINVKIIVQNKIEVQHILLHHTWCMYIQYICAYIHNVVHM